MNRSDTLTKIAPALVKALGQIEGAAKSAVNPHFRNRYANLESVIDASKEILTAHGITLIQLPGPVVDGNLTLETVLLHESGEYISGEGALPIGKQDPQGAGSALTYLRRYAQMAALNMPAVDDDGEAAHGRGSPSQARQAPPRNGAQEVVREQLEASVDALKRSPNGRLIPAEAKRQKIHEPLVARIDKATDAELDEIVANFAEITKDHPESWLDGYRDRIRLRRDELNAPSAPVDWEARDREFDESFRNTVGSPSSAPLSGRGRQPEGVA